MLDDLRDPLKVEATLRAAFVAHPFEFQTVINKIIDDVPDNQLEAHAGVAPTSLRTAIQPVIARNPLAAINTHPVMKKAIYRSVATLPAVSAAERVLKNARETARLDILKNKTTKLQVKEIAMATLANQEQIRIFAEGIHAHPELLQALGRHIPVLLNVPWAGASRHANVDEIIVELRRLKPERLVEIFTDPAVIEQVTPLLRQHSDLAKVLNGYVADDEASLEAAIDRKPDVMKANIAYENIRHAAANDPANATAIYNDPLVQQTQQSTNKNIKQNPVIEKLYEHLKHEKSFTTTRIKTAVTKKDDVTKEDVIEQVETIDTIQFRPDGLSANEPSIVVSANDMRDVVIQLVQNELASIQIIADRQAKHLKLADICKENTKSALRSFDPKTEAIENLKAVIEVVKDLQLSPEEAELVKRAGSLLARLEKETDPLAQLFSQATEDVAKQKKTDTENEVVELEGKLVKYRKEKPAELRKLGAIAGAAEDDARVRLVTAADIIAKRVPAAIAGNEIQKARAEDYIKLINEDVEIQKIYDKKGLSPAQLESEIAAELPKAMTRIFRSELDVVRAEVLYKQAKGNADFQRILAAKGIAEAEPWKHALSIVQAIADNNEPPIGIIIAPPPITQVRAIELLTQIDNDARMQKTLNETLDNRGGSKAATAWEKAVEADEDVKQRTMGIVAAKDKSAEATVNYEKIKEQRETKAVTATSLTEQNTIVKETNQHKKDDLVKTLGERQALAEERKEEKSMNRSRYSPGP